MTELQKRLGKRGEDFVEQYLKKNGYKIRDRNYRCRFGEIDIVAEKDKEIVFIEVKTRKSFTFGQPEEAIDRRKQQKIMRTAEKYIQDKKLEECFVRIDAIFVVFDHKGKMSIKHLENAVEDD
jgi:putative endonuclease